MIPIHTAFSFWGRVPMQPLLLFYNSWRDQAGLGFKDNSLTMECWDKGRAPSPAHTLHAEANLRDSKSVISLR